MATGSTLAVTPSYLSPEVLVQGVQKSGYMALFPNGEMSIRLTPGSQAARIGVLKYRTPSAPTSTVGQTALPGIQFAYEQIQTPAYIAGARAVSNYNEGNVLAERGVPYEQVLQLGLDAVIFGQLRNMGLYGVTPSSGEGLLNTPGATVKPLGVDSQGHSTTRTWLASEYKDFYLTVIQQALNRVYMDSPTEMVICGPQRILSALMVSMTIPVVSGTASYQTIGQLLKATLSESGVSLKVVYDDSLEGKGAGGSDAVVITLPSFAPQNNSGAGNLNVMSSLGTAANEATMMLADAAFPKVFITPLSGGATDRVAQLRATCGWGVLPDAVTILNLPY